MNTKDKWFSVLTHYSAFLCSTEFSSVAFPKHSKRNKIKLGAAALSSISMWTLKWQLSLKVFQDTSGHLGLCPRRASMFFSSSSKFLVSWGKRRYPLLCFAIVYIPLGRNWYSNSSLKRWQASTDGNGRECEQSQPVGPPFSALWTG